MCPAARKETRLEETTHPASTNSVHGGTVSGDRGIPPSWVVYLCNLVRTEHDLAIFEFLLSSLHQRKGQRQKIRVNSLLPTNGYKRFLFVLRYELT